MPSTFSTVSVLKSVQTSRNIAENLIASEIDEALRPKMVADARTVFQVAANANVLLKGANYKQAEQ